MTTPHLERALFVVGPSLRQEYAIERDVSRRAFRQRRCDPA
jgi:hypothetical protein